MLLLRTETCNTHVHIQRRYACWLTHAFLITAFVRMFFVALFVIVESGLELLAEIQADKENKRVDSLIIVVIFF